MSRSILRLQSNPFLENGIGTGRKHFSKTLSYTALGSWWALVQPYLHYYLSLIVVSNVRKGDSVCGRPVPEMPHS